MEGTKIGPQDLGASEHVVEIFADDFLTATPLRQPAVAPKNLVLAVNQHQPIGHTLQDTVVADQLSDLGRPREMVGIAIDRREVFACEMHKRFDRRKNLHNFDVFTESLTDVYYLVMRPPQVEDPRSC